VNNVIEFQVNCALCSGPLEAGVIEGEIFARPCPKCQLREVKKVFVDLDPVDPDVVERYTLKTTPVRGTYMGRSKTGNFVRFGTLKKMHNYARQLERDNESMRGSVCTSFVRCPECNLLHDQGWVCPCGNDHE
jgi:hypothetical protein